MGDGSALNAYVAEQFDASLNWSDVQWLVKYEPISVIGTDINCTHSNYIID